MDDSYATDLKVILFHIAWGGGGNLRLKPFVMRPSGFPIHLLFLILKANQYLKMTERKVRIFDSWYITKLMLHSGHFVTKERSFLRYQP